MATNFPFDGTVLAVVHETARPIAEYKGLVDPVTGRAAKSGVRKDPVTGADLAKVAAMIMLPLVGSVIGEIHAPASFLDGVPAGAVIRAEARAGEKLFGSAAGRDFGQVGWGVSNVGAVAVVGDFAAILTAAADSWAPATRGGGSSAPKRGE